MLAQGLGGQHLYGLLSQVVRTGSAVKIIYFFRLRFSTLTK